MRIRAESSNYRSTTGSL